MAYTTKETSAAEEQCTIKGTHWAKQMVKFWTNYAYWAKDSTATWTGTHTFSNRGVALKRISFNEDASRTGEGACLFADQVSIGMAAQADCEGIKMEFDYGVAPTSTAGDGKMVHGLDIKMIMDQDWNFTTKPYNATVRGARIQAYSQNDISGRLMGAYINAQGQGTYEIEGYISGNTGPGMIGIEARTELATSAQITTPNVVGVLIFHRNKQDADIITGGYRGLQVEVPLMGTGATIAGTTYAINVANDWGGGDTFDYGLNIATGTCDNGIGIVVAAATASGKYGIYVNNSYTKTDGGVHKAISSVLTYTPSSSGYSTPIAIAGKVVLNSNYTGGTGYMWGIQGQLHFNNAAVVNNANSIFAAGRFVITADATPDFTECEEICGLYVDNLCIYNMSAVTTGNVSLLYLANQAASMIDYFIHVQGGSATPVENLFYFEGDANYITQGADSADVTHKLKVNVEGFGTRYLHLFST